MRSMKGLLAVTIAIVVVLSSSALLPVFSVASSVTYRIYVEMDDGTNSVETWTPDISGNDQSSDSFVTALKTGLDSLSYTYSIAYSGKISSITADNVTYSTSGTYGTEPYYAFTVYYADGDEWKVSSSYNEGTTMAIVFAKVLFTNPENDKYVANGSAWTLLPDVNTDGTRDIYGGNFLIDRGNGDTEWVAIKSGSNYIDTVVASVTAAGSTCTYIGNQFTIDEKTETTIGSVSSGGSFSTSGTTGSTVTSKWQVYNWDVATSVWKEVTDETASCTSIALAVGFYPDGTGPVETPDYKAAWTMIEADAENSANQSAAVLDKSGSVIWYLEDTEPASGCYTPILSVQNHTIAKFGYSNAGSSKAYIASFDPETGKEQWRFEYAVNMIELSCALIAGDYIYVQSSNGYIFRFPWSTGPGSNYSNVTTYGGAAWDDTSVKALPDIIEGVELKGKASYGQGPYSMVYDSGCIFLKHYNGMVYCFDMNLNLVWSRQMEGGCYYSAPTVVDGYVSAGAYDGCLYILNESDGSVITKTLVYSFNKTDKAGNNTIAYGSVNTPIFIKTETGYDVFVSYSDGLIMSTAYSSLAIYSFNGASLTLKHDINNSLGAVTTYLTRYVTDDYRGVIFNTYSGTYKIDGDGNYSIITSVASKAMSSHATPTLVNGNMLYIATYGQYMFFMVDLTGKTVGGFYSPISQFSMCPVTVVDHFAYCSNDGGFLTYEGTFSKYVSPKELTPEKGLDLWQILIIAVCIILATISVFWVALRVALKWKRPFYELNQHIHHYFYGDEYRHKIKSKRKLYASLLLGILLTVSVCLMSLCIGNKTTMGVGEAIGALTGAIAKNGQGLTSTEYLIYIDRMPRVMAALGAGIGLSIAGAMYQAVIKNPLVEPYIMGVSSGAGTMAIAVITFNFTLFGLLSNDNPFLIAICAIIGGLIAFGITMLLAEKTGGKSVNYVLAGIVVGLVFSAIQSLMIVSAGNKISSALSWLYGSFNSVTWEQAWIVLIPTIALSMIPLIWAKEFNLVLLGEDQAQQMGLNAKLFDRIMLILASIITAFCVAFCGIIGFVGLVIPHASRMMLGGDHRLMLPLTITLGGFMMVLSDLLARVLVSGYELPVGAVTAIIGVPVFAYLLIKKGRNYDG
jgi:ABC-type Fe3+-siderophore transport system permease subunit